MEENVGHINTGATNGLFNISFIAGMPDSFCGKTDVVPKLINIVYGLELINKDLDEIYALHEKLRMNYSTSSARNPVDANKCFFKYHQLCRRVIHDLRVTCDMLIILTCMANDNIYEIGGISKYNQLYEKKDNPFRWCYDSYHDFFKGLIDCDNASKHHFLFDLSMSFQMECPSLSYVFCGKTQESEKPEIRIVPIANLIEQFNSFYGAALREFKIEQNVLKGDVGNEGASV